MQPPWPLNLDRHWDTVVGREIVRSALHKQFIPSLVVMKDMERAFVLETSLLRRPPTFSSKIGPCLFSILTRILPFLHPHTLQFLAGNCNKNRDMKTILCHKEIRDGRHAELNIGSALPDHAGCCCQLQIIGF